jgi:hypothetical protein
MTCSFTNCNLRCPKNDMVISDKKLFNISIRFMPPMKQSILGMFLIFFTYHLILIRLQILHLAFNQVTVQPYTRCAHSQIVYQECID